MEEEAPNCKSREEKKARHGRRRPVARVKRGQRVVNREQDMEEERKLQEQKARRSKRQEESSTSKKKKQEVREEIRSRAQVARTKN
jgi:hypothetical protein